MPHLFAFNCILLVREGKRRAFDSEDRSLVIQRCVVGVVEVTADGQGDVAEEEGRGSGGAVCRLEVFGGSEEPEEGHDHEVEDVCVEGAVAAVAELHGFTAAFEDGEVGGVGAEGRLVFVAQGR